MDKRISKTIEFAMALAKDGYGDSSSIVLGFAHDLARGKYPHRKSIFFGNHSRGLRRVIALLADYDVPTTDANRVIRAFMP